MELPTLKKFQLRHPGINFIAVDIVGYPQLAKSFLAAHKLAGLHVAITNGLPWQFGMVETPSVFVLDRFGRIQFVHAGLLPDAAAILDKDLAALPKAR